MFLGKLIHSDRQRFHFHFNKVKFIELFQRVHSGPGRGGTSQALTTGFHRRDISGPLPRLWKWQPCFPFHLIPNVPFVRVQKLLPEELSSPC